MQTTTICYLKQSSTLQIDLDSGRNNAGFNFAAGAAQAAVRVNPLGAIMLPMPDNIKDINSVSWESDTLDSLSAKALNTGMGAVDAAKLR